MEDYERSEDMLQEEGAQEAPENEAAETQGESAAGERDAAQEARDRIGADVQSLYEDGWTIEQLQAFAQDEEAQAALAQGKTARQAATAYLMRRMEGRARGGKHGVPGLRTAAAGSVPRTHAIDRMSSSEFAQFSDGVYERLMAGEKISL